MQLLRQTVEAFRRGTPDDIHTAVRVARYVEVLLDAVLRPSTAQERPFGSTTERTPTAAKVPGHMDQYPPGSGSDFPLDFGSLGNTTWWNDTLDHDWMT